MYARRDRSRTHASHDPVGRPVVPEPALASTAVLALQRSAGNRAVTRVLQRAPSGLKDAKTTSTFTSDALGYWRDAANQAKGIGEYALFLTQKANASLAAIGVPAMKPDFDPRSRFPGSFWSDSWKMTMNTTIWGKKQGASKLSDLTLEEAADGAATIYHEARHAEQRFQIARMLAGQSKAKTPEAVADELVKTLKLKERSVAVAAAAAPLADTAANADLLAEVRDWRAVTGGIHAPYREVVNDWLGEVMDALGSIRALTAKPMEIDRAKGVLAPVIHGWSKDAKRTAFLAKHRKTAEAIKTKTAADSAVVSTIKAIQGAAQKVADEWKAMETAWAKDGPGKKLEKVYAFKTLLFDLQDALQAAYRAQAHEKDAFETGDPVAAQFKQGAKPAAGAPAKTP
jgi:hypothetical protein